MQFISAFAIIFDIVSAQAQCTALGGSCVSASVCNTEYSNIVHGLCPGAADIRCCVPVACNIPADGGKVFAGGCRPVSTCSGKKASSLCPGDASIQCCSTAAASINDPVTSIATTNLTPRGSRFIVQSDSWKTIQLQRPFISSFPQKAQCANNLSKVMTMAGFDFVYNSPLVMGMINGIKSRIPASTMSRDYAFMKPKQSAGVYAAQFTNMFGGYLPIGTVVGGCLYPNCEGESGDGHISFVCKVTDAVWQNGALMKANFHLCHNNWLRKGVNTSRQLIDSLGTVGQYMVDQRLYNAGTIERQWMATPWLQLQWKDGKVSNVVSLLPEIDDLDPFQYYLYIAIPVEITSQLKTTDRIYKSAQ
jgi:hypothetical protein